MEFSIYKLTVNKEDFHSLLRGNFMSKIGKTESLEISKMVDGEDVIINLEADFYFKSTEDNKMDIDWANYWAPFFGDKDQKQKVVESPFGMITLSLQGHLYAVSLGRAHSYANKVADLNFGLDLAEMLLDEYTIEVKSAKYFKQSKNKSLTQYNRKSIITSEIGESHELVIGKLEVDSKYDDYLVFSYDKKVRFGSAVKIEVGEYKPIDFINIVMEFHVIYQQEYNNRKLSLPRITFLKNNEDNQPRFADLNRKLISDFLNDESVNVSLSYFLEDGGEIIIEPVNADKVELVFDRKTHDVEFDLHSIRGVLIETGCEDITKVSIRPKQEHSKKRQLMELLDYCTVYNGKNYCLYKGKWAIFNDSYINHIEKEITKVNDCCVVVEELNLSNEVLQKGRDYIKAEQEKYDSVNYAEYPYNVFLEKHLSWVLMDRKREHALFNTVEFADLYDPNRKQLVHVKIGSTPDIRYCIQQSLHSADIYNRHDDVLEVYGVDAVNEVAMLLVLTSNKVIKEDNTVDFSINKSIYLKVEIIEWYNRMRSLNYEPSIIIAKDVRQKKSSE